MTQTIITTRSPRDTYLLKLFPFIKQEKIQAFTTAILTLLAASLFGIFAISPTIATIVQLQKQIKDSEYVNTQLETKLNNIYSLIQQYNGIQNDLPLITQALPQSPFIPQFLAKIQSLANENAVVINNIQTQPVEVTSNLLATNSNKYTSLNFSVDVSGSSVAILQFLSALNNFDRVVTMESLGLFRQDTNTRMTITGTTYFKQL